MTDCAGITARIDSLAEGIDDEIARIAMVVCGLQAVPLNRLLPRHRARNADGRAENRHCPEQLDRAS